MDWMESVIESARDFQEIRYSSRLFRWRGRVEWRGDEAPFEAYRYGFYVPVDDEWWRTQEGLAFVPILAKAEKEAPLLAKSIIDESLPVELDTIDTYYWNFMGGGRRAAADILGMMQYCPALPYFREAMMHDLSDVMRRQALRSIKYMGRKANGLTPDVCEALSNDRDFYARVLASKTLNRIGDKRASVPLRDAFEFARFLLQAFPKLDDYSRESADIMYLLEESLISLFGVDVKSAMEAFDEGIHEKSIHTRYFTKRAAELAGKWKMIEDKYTLKI